MSSWKYQPSSKLGRSIVTQVTTTQTNASVTTTNFGTQTYQVRIVHNLSAGIWATIDTTATITGGPPPFTLGYSLQANINTVTHLCRTVTVSSQHCGKQWKIQRPECTLQWQ